MGNTEKKNTTIGSAIFCCSFAESAAAAIFVFVRHVIRCNEMELTIHESSAVRYLVTVFSHQSQSSLVRWSRIWQMCFLHIYANVAWRCIHRNELLAFHMLIEFFATQNKLENSFFLSFLENDELIIAGTQLLNSSMVFVNGVLSMSNGS